MRTEKRDSPPAHCAGHLVQFYEDAIELYETVGEHLRRAIEAGEVVLVVATEEHRQGFEAHLSDCQIDVELARVNGTWVTLDAERAVQALSTGGGIDRQAFDDLIGTAVRAAAQHGREICAYGEMVELLWRAGHVVCAIELEELWNELREEISFSLLCAYYRDTVSGPGDASALAQVCALHNGVLRQFPAERDAPRHARQFLSEVLGLWGHEGSVIDDAQLVLSELATNAVVHAQSAFSVTAGASAASVRLSVRDGSQMIPLPRHGTADRLSGRGLQLVSSLADAWGFELSPDGKTVWAELRPV